MKYSIYTGKFNTCGASRSDFLLRVPLPASTLIMVSPNDVQRLFLQAVFSRRLLSVELAQTIWAKCAEAVKSDDNHSHPDIGG
jgi:hypothetical protein